MAVRVTSLRGYCGKSAMLAIPSGHQARFTCYLLLKAMAAACPPRRAEECCCLTRPPCPVCSRTMGRDINHIRSRHLMDSHHWVLSGVGKDSLVHALPVHKMAVSMTGECSSEPALFSCLVASGQEQHQPYSLYHCVSSSRWSHQTARPRENTRTACTVCTASTRLKRRVTMPPPSTNHCPS